MALPGTNPRYKYLDNNYESDGTVLGQSATSSKIGFWAAAPVVQPTSASPAVVTTDAATTGAATYGFTSVQANGIVRLLNRIRLDLVTVGIIKGS